MIQDSMSLQGTSKHQRVPENEMSRVSARLSVFDKGRTGNDGGRFSVTNNNKMKTYSKADDPNATTKPTTVPSTTKRNKVAMKYWDVIKKHQKAQSVVSALKAPPKRVSVDGQSNTPEFLRHRGKLNATGLLKEKQEASTSSTGSNSNNPTPPEDTSTTTTSSASDSKTAEPTEAEGGAKKRSSLKSAMGKSTGKDLWKILKKKNRTRTIIQKMVPAKAPEFQQVKLQSTGQLDELKKGGKDQYLERKKEQKSQLSEKDTQRTKQLLNSRRSSLARVQSFTDKDEKQKRRSSLLKNVVIEEEDEPETEAKAQLRPISKSPEGTSAGSRDWRGNPLTDNSDSDVPTGLYQNRLKSVAKPSSRTCSTCDIRSTGDSKSSGDAGFKRQPRNGSMPDLDGKISTGTDGQMRNIGSTSAHARTDLSKRPRFLPPRHGSFNDIEKNLKLRKSDGADRAVLDVSNLRNNLRPSATKEYRKEEVVVDNRHVLLTKKPTFGIFLKGLIPTEPGLNEYTTAPIDEVKTEEFSGFDLEMEPLLDGREKLETETGEIVDMDDSVNDNASGRRGRAAQDGSDDEKSTFEVRLRCIKKENDNTNGPFNPFEVSYQINLKNTDESADSKGGKSSDYFELELRPMKQRMLRKTNQNENEKREEKDDKPNSVQLVLRHIADPANNESTMTATESMMEVPLPSLESMVGKENKAPLFEIDLEHARPSLRRGSRFGGGRPLEGSAANTDFRTSLRKTPSTGPSSPEESDDNATMGRNLRAARALRSSKKDSDDSQLIFKLRKNDPNDPSGTGVSETTFDIKLNATDKEPKPDRRKDFGKFRQASFEMRKLRKAHLESLDQDGETDDLDESNDDSASSVDDVKLEPIQVYEEKAIVVEEPAEDDMKDYSMKDNSLKTNSEEDISSKTIDDTSVDGMDKPVIEATQNDFPKKGNGKSDLNSTEAVKPDDIKAQAIDDTSVDGMDKPVIEATQNDFPKKGNGKSDLNSTEAVKPDDIKAGKGYGERIPVIFDKGNDTRASDPQKKEEASDAKDSTAAVEDAIAESQQSESIKRGSSRSSSLSMGVVDENSPLAEDTQVVTLKEDDPSDGGGAKKRKSESKKTLSGKKPDSRSTSGSSIRVEDFTRRRTFLDDSSDDDSSSCDTDSDDEDSDRFDTYGMNSSMPAIRKSDEKLARAKMLQKAKHDSFREDIDSSQTGLKSPGGSVQDNLRREAEERLRKQQERMERRQKRELGRMSLSSSNSHRHNSLPTIPDHGLTPYYAVPPMGSSVKASSAFPMDESYTRNTDYRNTRERKARGTGIGKVPDQFLVQRPDVVVCPTIESEVEELRRKCYMWYARLGAPTRMRMKSKVKVLASSCDITVDDVDLLPWDQKGLVLSVPEMTELFMNS